MKSETIYFHEDAEGQRYNCPWDGEVIFEKKVGSLVVLGVLCRDEDAQDPFAAGEERVEEFGQFNPRNIHFKPRSQAPDFETYRGRLFGVVIKHGDYAIDEKDCPTNEWADNCAGYLIIPDDVPIENAELYARSVLQEYNDFCKGDVFGICVWVFSPDGSCGREEEVWGYYGEKYATECLKDEFYRVAGQLENEMNHCAACKKQPKEFSR